MTNLWKKLEPWVRNGVEARKIDLKRELDLGPRPNRTKLVQLICAIANTPGGTGYIVLGVLDKKDRAGLELADAVCGIDQDPENYERQLQQALADAASPVPPARYETLTVPGLDKRIGIIVVEPSGRRPHELIRDSEGIRRGFYVRRGAETFPATRDDLEAMFDKTKNTAILVNFAHPITPAQIGEIRERAGICISEVVDVPVHFDDGRPFSPQVSRIIDAAGLTEEEWQTVPVIVNVPGFAYIASALIAELHGRSGHFATILRLKRSPEDTTKFLFAELIQLQEIRDSARTRR